MTEKIMIAGSGGQGVLFSGKLLAEAAIKAGYNVIMVPSYGAEMRGGTANCTVIISDEEILSPIIDKPDTLICLNGPSLEKFENKVKNHGLLLFNNDSKNEKILRDDITVFSINGEELAIAAGSSKIVNMPFIGAYTKISKLIPINVVLDTISEIVSEHYKKILEINIKALKIGYNAVN